MHHPIWVTLSALRHTVGPPQALQAIEQMTQIDSDELRIHKTHQFTRDKSTAQHKCNDGWDEGAKAHTAHPGVHLH